MMTVSVTEKGQVLIPATLRKKFHIKKGSKIQVEEWGNGCILMKPLPDDIVEATRGILKGKISLTRSLLEERKKEASLG
jgi:AbrB family looped-hinge helix DNA binding protein